MKDLAATALDTAQQAAEASSSSDSDEFGLPRFCYIGCGSWGCRRVAAGLADRSYDTAPRIPLQQLTTSIYVGRPETACPVRTATDFRHNAARTSAGGDRDGCDDRLVAAITETDICLLTLSLTDADAVTTAVTLARKAVNTPVLVFAATDGQHAETTLQRLTTAANTTLLFDESVIREGPLGHTAAPTDELTARLAREFITDAVEIPTISGAIGTRYPRVASYWDTGGLTIPSLARLGSDAPTAARPPESLLPLARTSAETEAWVGYVVGGKQFTLDEFDRLRTTLQATVGERAAENGVLGGRVHPDMETGRYLTLLQMCGDER